MFPDVPSYRQYINGASVSLDEKGLSALNAWKENVIHQAIVYGIEYRSRFQCIIDVCDRLAELLSKGKGYVWPTFGGSGADEPITEFQDKNLCSQAEVVYGR